VSNVTLATRDLVNLLKDVRLTAGSDEDYPQLAAVLLDCDRADVRIESPNDEGGEPLIDVIPSNVLVASAMDGFTMASQGHAPCDGWLHRAVLIATDDVDAVAATFAKKAKAAPKSDMHRTKVSISGDGVTFSEVHPAVLNGTTMTVRCQDLSEYPHGIETTLAPDPVTVVTDRDTKKPVLPEVGSGFAPAGWDVVSKVERNRKMPAVLYRYHHRRLHVVEVGTMWRAVFHPIKLDDPDHHKAPQVPVFAPRLPKKDAEDPDAEQSALV
jgi:hypothetical protein